jgi:hypothetical protein
MLDSTFMYGGASTTQMLVNCSLAIMQTVSGTG